MTIDTMTILMNKLTQLHKSLLTVSQAKTEALKHNGIEEMQKLLQQERKHVQAVKQIEKQRAEAAAEWFEEQGYTDRNRPFQQCSSFFQERKKWSCSVRMKRSSSFYPT